MESGFVLNKSHANDAGVAAWVSAALNEDISSIPGIGPASAALFADVGVTSTYQVIGYYLMLRDPGMKTQAHCDAFYNWLKNDAKLNCNCHTIVRCIAERCAAPFPGLYVERELTRHS